MLNVKPTATSEAFVHSIGSDPTNSMVARFTILYAIFRAETAIGLADHEAMVIK